MKIRSKTDVITNSSTEVFILDTDKPLEEVKEILKSITSGYKTPEYQQKDSEALHELIDFGYLCDPDDPESVKDFKVSCLNIYSFYNKKTWEEIEIPGQKEINKAWKKFIWENREYINSEFHKANPNSYQNYNPIDERRVDAGNVQVSSYNLPDGFVEKFLDSYQGIIPDHFNLTPDHKKNANRFVGKIGFIGEEDNSIPYETWETIQKLFGGSNWHLG